MKFWHLQTGFELVDHLHPGMLHLKETGIPKLDALTRVIDTPADAVSRRLSLLTAQRVQKENRVFESPVEELLSRVPHE